jgi:hypothetical protein
MFMTPASTSAVGSSIGVGFASATVLKAMSNAAGIKGFIGLPSLLNASGNDRPVPRFQNVQFRTHEIVPQSGGCHLMTKALQQAPPTDQDDNGSRQRYSYFCAVVCFRQA